jgi:hypothetical protein
VRSGGQHFVDQYDQMLVATAIPGDVVLGIKVVLSPLADPGEFTVHKLIAIIGTVAAQHVPDRCRPG